MIIRPKRFYVNLLVQAFLRKLLETKFIYDFSSNLLVICVDNTSLGTEN